MGDKQAVIIGAGMGGLSSAIALAVRGIEVTVLERAARPGGKLRRVAIAGREVDAGPTVLTMRWVFEEIFRQAGTSLDSHLHLQRADIIARHAWSETERLDLFADLDRSVNAIAEFAGPAEARRYRHFCDRARSIHNTLDATFIRTQKPSFAELLVKLGPRGLLNLQRLNPYTTLWRKLGQHFRDPRLRQLFGRYATYCGASPYQASPTLMLIAHVEQEGVWLVDGGMYRIVQELTGLAEKAGVKIRYGCDVQSIGVQAGRAHDVQLSDGERISADVIISNADAGALAAGLFGKDAARAAAPVARAARSLSAMTWTMVARTSGFPLLRHSVFFSRDYQSEFDDIFRYGRTPQEPTVYVCAQDRTAKSIQSADGVDRLLLIVNAPPNGDTHSYGESEIEACEKRTRAQLARCGLYLHAEENAKAVTSPAHFEKMFPVSGGAIYGAAAHGWSAAFRRPGARSRLPGLYLVGGSTHPGPGIAMAALSGLQAADSILSDLASHRVSTPRSPGTAMLGGMSTP